MDADPRCPRDEVGSVAAVAVSNQVLRLRAPGRRLEQLPPDPLRRRMAGHVDVHDSAPVVSDEDDRVEGPQHRRLHGKQVDSPDVLRMILEESAPPLGRRAPQHLTPVAMDGARTHREAQRPQLADDANRAPARVLTGESSNQIAQFGIDSRAPWWTATLPRPVTTPGGSMPADHRLRTTQLQVNSPRPPTACDDRPEDAIFVVELRLRLSASVDRELLAQDQILHQQITARAQQPTKQTKQETYVHPHRRPSGRLGLRGHR